jgi:hypothetical protein
MKKSIALLLILSFIILPLTVVPQMSASTPYIVSGKVIDRNGNPVANAKVELINDLQFGSTWTILATQFTDVNGNFHFVNVLSTSPFFKTLITYTENGNTYSIGQEGSRWTDGTQGVATIDTMWTTLQNYPPPAYGYLWGMVLAEGGNSRALGNAAVYVQFSEQKYYSFSSSNGAFEMYLPVGHYRVYGQYDDNGMLYQSSKIVEVNVKGATDKIENDPLQLYINLGSPANNPVPPAIPGTFINTINGTVSTQDGLGVQGAAVTLYQEDDSLPGVFHKKTDTITDSNGNYRFSDVKVTSNPPDNKVIYGMKTFRISASYTDTDGALHVANKSFPLYNPNVILGIGKSEEPARNMSANLQFDYSTLGWIKIQTEQAGAKVFVDDKPLLGPGGKQLVTPCTAYMPAGDHHKIRLSLTGYSDKIFNDVKIDQNLETVSIICSLDKPMVPGWVILAVSVLILLVVAGLILAVLASKRHMFMGPLSGVLGPITKTASNFRSSSAERKAKREAQKAHAAEIQTSEKAHRAQMADAALASKPKLDGRRREQDSFHVTTERPRLPEHASDDLSMVSARDVYRKAENPGIERIAHAQATGSMAKASYGGRDMPAREPTFRESPITAESDGRIRVPRATPAARDQPASSLKDKERVIRYVRERGDGVSFIQMSNELEIPPNTLTIITKELVINDDIEKVRGLYFFKKYDTSPEDGKSSVVVWRLDGED